MKKIWIIITAMTCVAFAGNIINADGSINKESDAYKKANEKCFNGCDYDDWKITDGEVTFSTDGVEWKTSYKSLEKKISEDSPVFIGFADILKTDHWNTKTSPSIPVVIRINAENGFKYYMVVAGNGDFSWVRKEFEGIYKFNLVGNKEGNFKNKNVLKFSSLKSGTINVEVIYLNESLNRRYGKKFSIYVYPKKH